LPSTGPLSILSGSLPANVGCIYRRPDMVLVACLHVCAGCQVKMISLHSWLPSTGALSIVNGCLPAGVGCVYNRPDMVSADCLHVCAGCQVKMVSLHTWLLSTGALSIVSVACLLMGIRRGRSPSSWQHWGRAGLAGFSMATCLALQLLLLLSTCKVDTLVSLASQLLNMRGWLLLLLACTADTLVSPAT